MKLKIKKVIPENKNFCEAKLVISINSVNTDCYDLLGDWGYDKGAGINNEVVSEKESFFF